MESEDLKKGHCINCGVDTDLKKYMSFGETIWQCDYCAHLVAKEMPENRNLAACFNVLERRLFEKNKKTAKAVNDGL